MACRLTVLTWAIRQQRCAGLTWPDALWCYALPVACVASPQRATLWFARLRHRNDAVAAPLQSLAHNEEALAATQEAVALYRAIAAARPATFRPDLAHSLNVLGACFAALDRHAEALDACEAAVRALLPAFQRLPAAFADQMASSVRESSIFLKQVNCGSAVGHILCRTCSHLG